MYRFERRFIFNCYSLSCTSCNYKYIELLSNKNISEETDFKYAIYYHSILKDGIVMLTYMLWINFILGLIFIPFVLNSLS